MSDPVLQGLIPGIERLAQSKVAAHRLPGMALGIVRDRELAWFGGFGAADLDSGATPTDGTIARVASVTKTFTATAIMQLRDEGRLTLEDPLARHVPEFASARAVGGDVEGVTLRRLLTHRSGLVTESPTHGWAALDFPSREEILARLPETGIVIPQDSAFKYSNLAFGLLGEVVYRVTGTPYAEYVHTHIIEPLGLTSTVYDLTAELRPRFFTGYNPSPYQDRPERAPYAHLNGISAGGQLHSTVSDLARWVSFQFRGGAQVLRAETLLEIQRPQYVEPDWSAGQCIGWRATRIGDRVHHNHGGGIHGFATQVWFNVPGRTGVVLLLNMWPPPGGLETAQEVLEMVLQADEAAPSAPEPPRLEPAPEALGRFVGYYRAEPGIDVNIEWRDGALRLVPHGGSALSLHAPAVLEATGQEEKWVVRGGRAAGETALFTLDEGRVVSYELGALVFRKLV